MIQCEIKTFLSSQTELEESSNSVQISIISNFKKALKQMSYFIFKRVLSLTSYKVKQTIRTKMCTGQFKGNYIRNNEIPFILREMKGSNKLSLVLVQRKTQVLRRIDAFCYLMPGNKL